jgi:hypothetical protein
MTAKATRGIELRSDTHRVELPPEWALQVSQDGAVFLGPNGEQVTVSAVPLPSASRIEPLMRDSSVSREETRATENRLAYDLVVRGPAPELRLHCRSEKGDTAALQRLSEALQHIEWYPPQAKTRPWWRFW